MKPKYHLYKSRSGWALAFLKDPITSLSDEESARRAARFVNADISHGMIWDADKRKWVGRDGMPIGRSRSHGKRKKLYR